MANFTNSYGVESGVAAVLIYYQLYGDVTAALDRNGASVKQLIGKTLEEIANIGVSFDIMYHSFEMEFPDETLQFAVSSARYEVGGHLEFDISLVDKPVFSVSVSQLPETTLNILRPFMNEPD